MFLISLYSASQVCRTIYHNSMHHSKLLSLPAPKLTSNWCTMRLRFELQAELQNTSIKSEADHQQARQELEGSLSQEIDSHVCPICYDLTVAPRNAPILIFPCGRFLHHPDKYLLSAAFLLESHLLPFSVMNERLCRAHILQWVHHVSHSASQKAVVSLL